MIHDENNLLTDDELVVIGGSVKKVKSCVFIYTKRTFSWILC